MARLLTKYKKETTKIMIAQRKRVRYGVKEQVIQKQILDYLKYNKVFCFKYHSAGIKKQNGQYIPVGMKGVSDIIGILEGRFLAIEVKRHPNKPSLDQLKFIDHINDNGGLAFVAYSVDDVVRELSAVDNRFDNID